MAKAQASDAAVLAARQALQCHGAIGYSFEYDLHLCMKRAWALAARLGRRRLAPRPRRTRDPGLEATDRFADDRRPAMPEAYIVDAVRTPVGKRGGGLSPGPPGRPRRPRDPALVERNDLDPLAVEDVVLRLRRRASARRPATSPAPAGSPPGCPEEVPGTTIDRQCGSSQQAVHFAAQAVMSGTNDVIVAGGVQNMSMIPIASAMTAAEPLGFTDPFSGSKGWVDALRRPRRCRSSAPPS